MGWPTGIEPVLLEPQPSVLTITPWPPWRLFLLWWWQNSRLRAENQVFRAIAKTSPFGLAAVGSERYEGTDGFAFESTGDIALLEQREDPNVDTLVATEGEGFGVHHLEIITQTTIV